MANEIITAAELQELEELNMFASKALNSEQVKRKVELTAKKADHLRSIIPQTVNVAKGRILFPNFKGATSKYDAVGKHYFTLGIDAEQAADLQAVGIPVRVRETDDATYYSIRVNVSNKHDEFNNSLTIYLHNGDKNISKLDPVDDKEVIKSIDDLWLRPSDFVLSPYVYHVNGDGASASTGVTMYMRIGHIYYQTSIDAGIVDPFMTESVEITEADLPF